MATMASDARDGAPAGGAAGSDAERRAAIAAAARLEAGGREARVQTLWVRPAWWIVQALCAAGGLAASILSVARPLTGLLTALVALALAALDTTAFSPLRRLTLARATQNVVSPPPAAAGERPITLIVTAAADRPRRGRASRWPGGALRWSLAALALVAACSAARLAGAEGAPVGLVQLGPTLVLLLALLAFLDEGLARPAPDDSASAAALALVRDLDARPPAHLGVALLLAGAGAGQGAGLRSWLAARRRRGMRPRDVALLEIAPCAQGEPVWWERAGLAVPTRLHPQLVGCARAAGAADGSPARRAARGRPAPPGAAVARAGGWPAIAVGALPGRAGTDDDEDPGDAAAATVAFAAALVRELDARLDERAADGGD
jgi:hypothetical protein